MADVDRMVEEDEGERARRLPLPLTPPLTEGPVLGGGAVNLSPLGSDAGSVVRHGEGASYLDFTGDAHQQLLGAGWRVSTQMRQAGEGLVRETRRLAFIETASQDGTRRAVWDSDHTTGDGRDLWVSPTNQASFLGYTLNEQHDALKEGRKQLDKMETETACIRSRFESENARMLLLRTEAAEVEIQLALARDSLKSVTSDVEGMTGAHEQLAREQRWAAELQSDNVRCEDLQEEVNRLKVSRRTCMDIHKDKLGRANDAIRAAKTELGQQRLDHEELARSNALLRKELSDKQSAHSAEVAETIGAYERQVGRLRKEREELLVQQDADEAARQKDAFQDHECWLEQERQSQIDQAAQIRQLKEASVEAELRRVEKEQRDALV